MSGEVRIGISGWTYPPWRGVFYPPKLPHRCELGFASREFKTIELNGSFYALQKPESFLKWHDETPDEFVFAIKANRFITHIRRLVEIEKPLSNFFASGVLALLPHDTRAASELAKAHDSWMGRRSYVETDCRRSLRHVIEVRHESFRNEEFVELLRRARVALVFSHSSGAWPYFEDVTADFVYLRLHGEGELYSGEYGDKALDCWARKIRSWRDGREPRDAERISPVRGIAQKRDVFLYFDNDVKVRAPFDARSLERRLGVGKRSDLARGFERTRA